MKYIITLFALLFAVPSFAMQATTQNEKQHEQAVQERLKSGPEMDAYCKKKIQRYKEKIAKYKAKVDAHPEKSRYKRILRYYEGMLKDWTEYCTRPETDETD